MKFIFGRAVQYGFFDRNNQLHFSFNVAKVWKEFKPINLQEPSVLKRFASFFFPQVQGKIIFLTCLNKKMHQPFSDSLSSFVGSDSVILLRFSSSNSSFGLISILSENQENRILSTAS